MNSHELDLVFTLTGGLTAALLLGFVALRIRLSPIVGYLLAGVVVGPFTPGFAVHAGLSQQLAEIGVVLLMFGVGLQFHMDELLAVRRLAIPGSIAGMAAGALGGGLAARAFGWSWSSSLIFGLALAISSTVVLIRVLTEHEALHTKVGQTAVGWLVVEDIVAVVLLVVLPVLTGPGEASPQVVLQGVLLAFAKVGSLLALTVVVGRRVVPRLLVYVAKTRARDLFTLTVLVLALGVAVGASKCFGVSMALGAFLAGLLVGQSPFGARAAADAIPMRDAFAVLFFVSVGTMLDPSQMAKTAPLAVVTLVVVLVAKPFAAYATMRALGASAGTAAPIAAALAQIGEFSFILVALGRSLGALSDDAAQALVLVAVLTITANPFLYRWACRRPGPRASVMEPQRDLPSTEEPQRRAVLVGYGPVGRTLAKLLLESEIEPTVVELNHELVDRAKADGLRAVLGDASQLHTMEVAGVARAASLIFAATGSSPEPAVRAAKELNPSIRIVARTHYVHDARKLRAAGASVVVTAEAEVAFAMAELLLVELGASGEQLERARERVRSELTP